MKKCTTFREGGGGGGQEAGEGMCVYGRGVCVYGRGVCVCLCVSVCV